MPEPHAWDLPRRFVVGETVRVRLTCRHRPGVEGVVRDLLNLSSGHGYGVVLPTDGALGGELCTDYTERELEHVSIAVVSP